MKRQERPGSALTELPVVRQRERAGFTLIELLVVIAIIAILVSVLIPSLRAAKDQAKAIICQSNERGIYGALSLYAEDHDGHIPRTGQQRDANGDWVDTGGSYTTTWNQFLCTYPEDLLEEAWGPSAGSDIEYWRAPISYVESIELFDCPARGDGEHYGPHQPYGGISYELAEIVGSYGLNMRGCAWIWHPLHETHIPDQMYLLADSSYSHFVLWGDVYDPNSGKTFEPRHGTKFDTINLMFMDGHIVPMPKWDLVDAQECEFASGYANALPWRNAHNIFIP